MCLILYIYIYILLLPLALQSTVGFDLSNNVLPFFSYLPPTLSIFSLPALEELFYTSSFRLFLGLPLLLVPSSSWVKIFLGILSSSILSSWPNQLILCPFIHFTIYSLLLISSSSRFVRLFHSPFSYLGPYILQIFSFQKLAELVLLSSSTSMLPLHHVTNYVKKKSSRFPKRHLCVGLILTQDNAQ